MRFFSRNGKLVSEAEAKALDSGAPLPSKGAPVKSPARVAGPPQNHNLTADAKAFIERTERRAEEILAIAKGQAKDIIDEANEKAQEITSQAQAKADEAIALAEKLLQDSQSQSPNQGEGKGSINTENA